MSHNNTLKPEVAAQVAEAVADGEALARTEAHIDALRDTYALTLIEAIDFYTRHGIAAGDLVAFNNFYIAIQALCANGGAK